MAGKKFIGANWKMNPMPAGALDAGSPYQSNKDVDVVVFPTSLDLKTCVDGGIITGAQCARPEAIGAFTGDISIPMIKGLGCTHVLCGHSDRRAFHYETDAFVGEQVAAAIQSGLTPVLCIGETASEHDDGKTKDALKRQLSVVLNQQADFSTLVIAYEPVWAISRGDPNKPAASTQDAQNAHKFIRSLLPKELQSLRIIYGGSMKGSNAAELLAQPDIDGGLVGGASLKPDDFGKIVQAAAMTRGI